jgi:EAL and modified HD-GYP domain-containing signal transduction protein
MRLFGETMERFVARQPIFDARGRVFAYELLFRSSLNNYFTAVDGNRATSEVIVDSFLVVGLDQMTGGKKAFINFTRETLIRDFALLLPREAVVVEILETVEPDAQVLDACRKLKKKGYTLALDDFVYDPRFEPLVELADVIKVDFLQSSAEERRRMTEAFIPKGIRMLAEKVETREDHRQAKDLGYSLFQGYFFSRPEVVAQKDVPANKINMLRILQEVHRAEMDFVRLAAEIQNEVSLSYKLLRLVNSAAFGLRGKVDTIQRALGFLGENGVRQWTSLLAMAGMAGDKPEELVVASLVRAKFCETLAPDLGLAERSVDLFLMGLFSHLEAMLGLPLATALADIPLSADIREALITRKGRLAGLLRIVNAYEHADWAALHALATRIHLPENTLAEAYLEAIQWPSKVLF